MRFSPVFLLFLSVLPVVAQEPGQGAPASIEQLFVNAFYRNRFNSYVSLPAVANVRALGTGGYVQEFADAKGNQQNKFALIKGTAIVPAGESAVLQIYPALYSYFNSVGVNTAGFPITDTSGCATYADPDGSAGTKGASCTYATFSKNYVLFTYPSTLLANDSNANYTLRDPFYTRWVAGGGITGLGPAVSAEVAFTSKTAITGVMQQYYGGALYNLTSGALTGKVFSVSGKVYTLFASLGLHTGTLGIPLTEELSVGNGVFRQSFEGGSVQYSATTDAILRSAVGSVNLSIATGDVTKLNLGNTLTIRATVTGTTGEQLTDRQTTWVTSNGRIVSVTPSADGTSAVLRAVGGGTAQITAVSEGKSSGALTIFVTSPCCQVGEGSPTTAIQQAFLDAAARLRLSIQLPAANPVRRAGLGYVQDLVTTDGTRYLLCRSDRSPGVFGVSGEILKAYELNGGGAGPQGYPIGDPTATGRQMFEGGALSGNPVQAVTDPILTRWGSLGFETGSLGQPVLPSRTTLSFTGSTGVLQAFANGLLVRTATGPFASTRVLQVNGKILTRYIASDGPDGDLGFPVSESYVDGDAIRQNFEGGQLFYRGDGDVEQQDQERRPQVTVTPGAVVAGGRVRVIIGGFTNGAQLRVSFDQGSGMMPFEVQTTRGSYAWEFPVALTSRTGIVTITAQAVGGGDQSAASYTVTALSEARTQFVKKRGDTQQGYPGAVLNTALTVSLSDEQGNPLIGVPVKFAASPGSQVEQSDVATDDAGEADAVVRLQSGDGIVLVTAEAAGKTVTFSARATGGSLTNFPKQLQTGSVLMGTSGATAAQKGALLAAVSSVIRYHQSRNDFTSSLGTADPATLNDFLKNFCVLDASGGRICDGYLTPAGAGEPVVNLWRLRDFLANNVDVETEPGVDTRILDLVNQGIPVIVGLSLTVGDAPVGSHFVVATGAGSDGSILIHDPNPVLGRARLDDYIYGFTLNGRAYKATLLQLIRLTPRSPSPTGFLVTSATSPIAVEGPSGACGQPMEWPSAAVIEAGGVTAGKGTAYMNYCSGVESRQIVRFPGTKAFTAMLTDLGNPGKQIPISGGGGESFGVTRKDSQWQVEPVSLSVSAASVVNAATGAAGIAPGSLVTVQGTGLGSKDAVPNVTVGGQPVVVQMPGEFRMNLEIPRQLAPGEYFLHIESVHGVAEVAVTLLESAPAIFQDAKTGSGMIVNVTGNQANTPANPVSRGGSIGIYATGLGPVRPQGNGEVTVSPVTVIVQGVELSGVAAPASLNLPGIYIVTVPVSQAVAPGVNVPMQIRQNGAESNTVGVSIR